ncbi:F0F1 ATP synthase subunit delta [Luteimicrobium subarcticum]|uniref:ATP synthase subunit delta n=1 Tax=Luteimicrobium subarcticum TaxID=620910 RepID=A0A2M8W1J5_9MICO|nr:F0F1 ATP synthase subunit delta [Luteimicrobium subarcticum]PJI84785.1 ATP synthase F1 subcomplex delta subunit [Luteimicrobium subarcticum]
MADGAMRGESGASLAETQSVYEPVLRAAGTEGIQLGEQLFAVTDALGSSAGLRRTLSDPTLPGAVKADLAAGLLGAFDARVVDVVRDLVQRRWAKEADLGHAVERLALTSVLSGAAARDALVTVEDELFRITRLLTTERATRIALSDDGAPVEARNALVEDLFAGKVDEVTLFLAHRATTNLRVRRFVPNLLSYADVAAALRQRLVASVTSAVELSAAQRERLGALLESAYGRPVQLNVTVDPAVVGGLRIQVGADVIDATMLARLGDARRRLAG